MVIYEGILRPTTNDLAAGELGKAAIDVAEHASKRIGVCTPVMGARNSDSLFLQRGSTAGDWNVRLSRRFVTRVVATLGIAQVGLADSGEKALEVPRIASPPFDPLISDIEMPVMDGFELVRKIRWGAVPEYKDVPFLMLTGQDTEENIVKGHAYRIQGFIVKPPKPDILRDHIGRARGIK